MKKPRATLDRILSKAGIASRTTARDWIQQGRVKVNGRVVKDPDFWVEQTDTVHFDGAKVKDQKRVYFALNKPTGVVTSTEDKKDRPTVFDLMADLDQWLFAVGRLDMDTSGLLILTNDTEFGEALLQPDSHVPKTYYVKVTGVVTPEEFARFEQGLDIGRGERSGPAKVKPLRHTEKYSWFELTISEGKNRQVRRMCEAIGHPVLKLVRIRIGNFELGDIPVGKFRKLVPADLTRLLQKK